MPDCMTNVVLTSKTEDKASFIKSLHALLYNDLDNIRCDEEIKSYLKCFRKDFNRSRLIQKNGFFFCMFNSLLCNLVYETPKEFITYVNQYLTDQGLDILEIYYQICDENKYISNDKKEIFFNCKYALVFNVRGIKYYHFYRYIESTETIVNRFMSKNFIDKYDPNLEYLYIRTKYNEIKTITKSYDN